MFAVNPFGIHNFGKKPDGTGDLTVAPGKSVTFHCRFLFHTTDEKDGKVAERNREFVETKTKP